MCVCLLVLFLQTGDVASRYARGHPVAALAHLACVLSSGDAAVPHLQVSDLAVGVWVWQGPFICRCGGVSTYEDSRLTSDLLNRSLEGTLGVEPSILRC